MNGIWVVIRIKYIDMYGNYRGLFMDTIADGWYFTFTKNKKVHISDESPVNRS